MVNEIKKLHFTIYLAIEKEKGVNVREISRILEKDKATIAKHLKTLESLKLITTDNGRPKRYYTI